MVAGWLLGILGFVLQERLRVHWTARSVIRAVRSEVIELRQYCASTTFVLEAKLGTLTKATLRWQRAFAGALALPSPLDQAPDLARRLEQASDEEFQATAAKFEMAAGRGLNLKELELPYTSSKLSDLQLFSPSAQQRVMQLLGHIRMYNQHVEDSRFFYKLTFDSSLSEEDHVSASEQVRCAYEAAAKRARLIADLITLALDELK